MTAAAIDLLMARREAESEMTDTCVITTGNLTRGEWNDEILDYDSATPEVSYEGPCKVRFGRVGARASEVAGQVLVEQEPYLSLPMGTSGAVRKDHVATITASQTDPALVGALFKITAARHQTNATSRKFPVKETS